MATPASQLVLDILEKVGADETLALLRAKLGLEGIPLHPLSLPQGVDQSDSDSPLLVDIVSSLVRRTYTPSQSGIFSSSRVTHTVEAASPAVVEEVAQAPSPPPTAALVNNPPDEAVVAASSEEDQLQVEEEQAKGEVEVPALEIQPVPQMEVVATSSSLPPPPLPTLAAVAPPPKPKAAEGYLDYEEDSSEEESSPVLKPTTTSAQPAAPLPSRRRGFGGSNDEEGDSPPKQAPPKKKGGWGDDDGSDDVKSSLSVPLPAATTTTTTTNNKAPPPPRQVFPGRPLGSGSSILEEDISDMDFGALSASSTSVLHRPSVAPPSISAPCGGSAAPLPHLPFTSHSTVAPLVASAVRSLQASPLPSQPMPPTLSGALRWLLVGERRVSGGGKLLYHGWIPQGLAFSSQGGVKYGIVQGLGGPCGPLAAVNAECVKRLYFGAAPASTRAVSASAKHWESFLEAAALPWEEKKKEGEEKGEGEGEGAGIELDLTPHALALALVGALTDILWRAVGDTGSSVVRLTLPESVGDGDTEGLAGGLVSPALGALTSPGGCPIRPFTLPVGMVVGVSGEEVSSSSSSSSSSAANAATVSSPQEGLFDRLTLVTCATRTATASALLAHLPLLTHPKGPGLLLIVASLIATRGWERVVKEKDAQVGGGGSGSTLIDANGYCTSELLHLFLCGRGVSNALNEGDVEVEGIPLGGIPNTCDVGFLAASLHLPVGSHLLHPRAPVWVTFAASHYRLLFAAPCHTVWPTLPPAPPKRLFGRKAGPPTLPPAPERCLGPSLAKWGKEGGGGLFDALLWDGLAKQGGMERVTVQVEEGGGEAPHLKKGERLDTLFAPTVLQLMARFGPGTRVLWNDVEEEEALFIE